MTPAADPELLDPAHLPRRPRGARRGNSAPIWIVIGALVLFGAAFAYDAMWQRDGRTADEVELRSGLSVADGLMKGFVAGEVDPEAEAREGNGSGPGDPAGGRAGQQALGGAGISGVAHGIVDGSSPARSERRDGGVFDPLGAPPLPDDFELVVDADAVPAGWVPPTASALQGSPSQGGRALPSAGVGERLQALQRTTATGDPLVDLDRGPEGSSGAGAYYERLRRLQEAGLLGAGGGADPREADPYARFAGAQGEDRFRHDRAQILSAPYALLAGSFIPATLQTGINSDLAGQVTALVAHDVRDTVTGRYVLIPQGSRLVGAYESQVHTGQQRLLIAWQRVQWPDGQTLDLGAMPGIDSAGYAGFKDQVDTHFWRILSSALLLSVVSSAATLSQGPVVGRDGQQTVGGVMAQALGQQLGQVSEEMIRRQMNMAPTLEIRPGYRFNVSVTKDLVFNGPYRPQDSSRAASVLAARAPVPQMRASRGAR